MKNIIRQITLITAFSLGNMLFSSCGGNEPPKEDTPKTNPSDLFKDDRPTYDPRAIDPAAPVTEISIKGMGTSMSDMSYDPKKITVKAGSTIKLMMTNTSTDASMPHNWVLVYDGSMEAVATAGITVGKEGSFVPNTSDVLIAMKLLGPGEVSEITFPAPPPGKYQFLCTYPGHWSLMNGEFIVE